MGARRPAPLGVANSLAVPCVADECVTAHSQAELLEALDAARRQDAPVTVLGGGTNVVPLRRVVGRALRLAMRGIAFKHTADGASSVTAAAGETWHSLVRACLGQGLGGLENLALIPGAVGAAPIQNIGAYGRELSSLVASVNAIDLRTITPVTLAGDACAFRYRDSLFKSGEPGRYVVTEITLRLGGLPPESSHRDLSQELRRMGHHATPTSIAEAVIRVRRRKLPDPRRIGNVGSFFKNPTVNANVLDQLRSGADVPAYPAEGGFRVPAARLIEACGWKGWRDGAAGVWPRHALVLVNYGGATGRQVLDLARRIADSVERRFQLRLEMEPVVLGED